MVLDPNTIWRDKVVHGVYSSDNHDPKKSEIREFLTWVSSMVTSMGYANYQPFETKALMDADLDHDADTLALVYDDAGNEGIYIKTGASGAGSWTKILDYLPGSQFVTATDAGAGSANAIVATSSPRVTYTDGVQLIRLNIYETNTSGTVAVAFDGGANLAVKTVSGADPAIGGLVAGMTVLGVVDGSGTQFRLISELSNQANFDHQGDWSAVATYTENQVVTGSDGYWYQLKVASSLNDNPVSGGSGDWLEILASTGIADGAVTTVKLADEAVTEAKLSPALLASLGSVTDFDYKADIEAATVPTGTDVIRLPDMGVKLDNIATPSPVEPWHVQSDNGRYFSMRFPDGRVDIRAFAGADQGIDFSTDDTTLFQYAAEYINRAWWETSGGSAQGDFQRGVIYVPPGAWTIDPTDPMIAYDYMKLVGAGNGQSFIRAQNTSAGSLIQRPALATYNSNQRTTHCLIEGIRFIPTGINQIMLDMRHCGRLTVRDNMCTRQDRPDEWNNANQTALAGTQFLQLNNSNATLVGGDVVLVEGNYVHWTDIAVRSGDATVATPGPEKLMIKKNEFSDCLNPVVVNDYGGAGGCFEDNTVQRWAIGSRALDIVARFWNIQNNYLECLDNDRPPILLRSGATAIIVHLNKHVNYTAQEGVAGPPTYQTLGSNDGTDCLDEYGSALASTFYGWKVY